MSLYAINPHAVAKLLYSNTEKFMLLNADHTSIYKSDILPANLQRVMFQQKLHMCALNIAFLHHFTSLLVP